MNERGLKNLLVILLAIASLATTALLMLTMLGRNQTATPEAANAPTAAAAVDIPLPAFSLTERSGQTVTAESLRGKVWIADFIFTRCAGPCPIVSASMAKLQNTLADHPRRDDIRLVTFTVDPTYDTPRVLATYADHLNADPDNWLFLTGERPQMWTLIEQGFKLPVFDNADDPLMPIGHSLKFVLVDQEGNIRGYYRAVAQRMPDGTMLGHERDALVEAVNRLLQGS